MNISASGNYITVRFVKVGDIYHVYDMFLEPNTPFDAMVLCRGARRRLRPLRWKFHVAFSGGAFKRRLPLGLYDGVSL